MVILTDDTDSNDEGGRDSGRAKEKHDDPFLDSDQADRDSAADAGHTHFVSSKQPPSRDSAGYVDLDFLFLFSWWPFISTPSLTTRLDESGARP